MRKFVFSLILSLSVLGYSDDHYVDPSDPNDLLNSIATELYTVQNILQYLTFTQFPNLIASISSNSTDVVVNVPPVDLTPIINRLDVANASLDSLSLQLQTLNAVNANIQVGNATLSDIYTLLNRGNVDLLYTAVSDSVRLLELLRSSVVNGFTQNHTDLVSAHQSLQALVDSVSLLRTDFLNYCLNSLTFLTQILYQLQSTDVTISDILNLLSDHLPQFNSSLQTISSNSGTISTYLTTYQSPYYLDYLSFRSSSLVLPQSYFLRWDSASGLSSKSTDSAYDYIPRSGNYFVDVLHSFDNLYKLQEHIIKGGVLNVVYLNAISNEIYRQTVVVTNRFQVLQDSVDIIVYQLTNDVSSVEEYLTDETEGVQSGINSANLEVFQDQNSFSADFAQSFIERGQHLLDAYAVDRLPDSVYWVGIDTDSNGNLVSAGISADIRPYHRIFTFMRSVSTFAIWAGLVLFVVCVWRLFAKLWSFLITCAYGTNND